MGKIYFNKTEMDICLNVCVIPDKYFWKISALFVLLLKNTYCISANSFRGNYSFLDLEVRKLFKGGKYSREETIVFSYFLKGRKLYENLITGRSTELNHTKLNQTKLSLWIVYI